MPEILAASVGFNKLKALGQLQLAHMWVIKINKPIGASITTQNDLDYFTITARTFELPGWTRAKQKIRYLDREYTVPMGQTNEHEFSIEAVNNQNGTVFNAIFNWYKEIPTIVSASAEGLANSKAEGVFYTLSMDGKTITNAFKITGIYPMDVPVLGGWSQDAEGEHSKFTAKFAFDEVIYDDEALANKIGTEYNE